MKYLTNISLLIMLVGCSQKHDPLEAVPVETVVLKLGMNEDDALQVLDRLNAQDISHGMQITGPPRAKWMWSIDQPKMSLETSYEDGMLTTLNVWDWSDRKLTSYHHTMQYDEMQELKIELGTENFEGVVIAVHNEEM